MMKFRASVFIIFLLGHFVTNAQLQSIDFTKKITPIGFFKTSKSFVLVTDTAVFSFNKKNNKWDLAKLFMRKVKVASAAKNKIWLGNQHYLFNIDDKNELTFWKGIKEGKIEVLSLKTNILTQEIIVSTADDGVFTISDSIIQKRWVENIRAEDACHCGNFDWIATSTGLLRLNEKGHIDVYAEEGVKGLEIPDNIVERLICSNNKFLFIEMSNQFGFLEIEGNESDTHVEGFSYVGSKNNKIFQQLTTPEGDFLFLTKEGLLLMKMQDLEKMHIHGASTEVYSSNRNPSVLRVSNSIVTEKIWQAGYFDEKQNLWLASDSNVLFISKKEFKKLFNTSK